MLVVHGASFFIISITLVACMVAVTYLLLHEDYNWWSTLIFKLVPSVCGSQWEYKLVEVWISTLVPFHWIGICFIWIFIHYMSDILVYAMVALWVGVLQVVLPSDVLATFIHMSMQVWF